MQKKREKPRSFIRYRYNAYPSFRGCAQSMWSNWWIAKSCPWGFSHRPKSNDPLHITIAWRMRHVMKHQLLWWIGEKLTNIHSLYLIIIFWYNVDEMNLQPNLQLQRKGNKKSKSFVKSCFVLQILKCWSFLNISLLANQVLFLINVLFSLDTLRFCGILLGFVLFRSVWFYYFVILIFTSWLLLIT